MNKLTIFRLLLAFTIVFVLLAVAKPTNADVPVQTIIKYDGWYAKGPSPNGPCPFTINIHMVGKFINRKWYDADNHLTEEQYIYGGNKYYVHANDKIVTVLNSGITTLTYLSPTQVLVKLNGQEWLYKIPGYGLVTGEVGQQTWTEFYDEDGNMLYTVIHKLVGNLLYNDVTPLMCGYLGP